MSLHSYQCFPLCVFFFFLVVVAAVLEGVNFSFGSRPDPYFVPSFHSSAVCSAVDISQTNLEEKKKKNTLNIWITFFFFFLIKGPASLIVLCSHFNFTFSLRVVLLFLL